MLKKASLRRIAVASTALIILGLLYLFPTEKTDKDKDFIQELVYTSEIEKSSIYLVDQNNYVARANIVLNSKDTKEMVEQIVETLTVNGKRVDYIPNGFKPIIPENTKLLSQSIDKNGVLKINFSKDILSVKKEDEEKMVEAIVYSLTTVNDIKKVMIFVEDNKLSELPNSKKTLPLVLDRNFGINKVYDIDDYKNTTKTTVYYVSKYNANYYYVPVTYVNNSTVNKVEIIINELTSSPINQTNLMSYLAANTELLEYEVLENKVNLSFNKYLLDDFEDKNILEEVKYSIGLSLKDTLNIQEVIFKVDNQDIATINLKELE